MKTVRKCSCGSDVILDKNKAKSNEWGWWQDCECKSTFLFPTIESSVLLENYKRRKKNNG